ncbi:hypothetical protein THAOC_37883, partial [Thalassiosira oceanica]
PGAHGRAGRRDRVVPVDAAAVPAVPPPAAAAGPGAPGVPLGVRAEVLDADAAGEEEVQDEEEEEAEQGRREVEGVDPQTRDCVPHRFWRLRGLPDCLLVRSFVVCFARCLWELFSSVKSSCKNIPVRTVQRVSAGWPVAHANCAR